ncbi:hypothetical protein MPTK1_4g16060 [Marchantia polymorpha subsp. ruderalis]|uniref:Uncharacterized protein n=2 Tax=Marchantia polymorpha TaxID=3197 RepID=A0AAF6BAD8_MARPO|nr:hypothetical protein MARPO_0054s0071 [Marchantia polymorpha]BBN08972.1 hypothetical protein Mp_4g16060 [Marchantia polymorpha subsp. ruderalis]|eukprot:PTQ37959.1 hypothetical protein MARPO_0054s0071 [Marchantia polymorpha]
MREVGADNKFPAPEEGFFWSHSSIHYNCQKRLLDLELNLSSSIITFEALQWAIGELERIEEQRHFPEFGDDATDDKADGAPGSRVLAKDLYGEKGEERVGTQTQDCGLVGAIRGLLSASLDGEKIEAASSGFSAGREVSDELPRHGGKNDGSADELTRGDFSNWRNRLNLASGYKRKSGEEESSYDGEKRARFREYQLSKALKDAVLSAVDGEAGKQMSQRINSRLEVPECVFLSNLVSHCLLVSLDQVPTDNVREALALTIPGASGAWNSIPGSGYARAENSDARDWMWLHRWFVRNLLPWAANDTFHASLDWLVAYMTASQSSITKLVLDDLVADLNKCESDGCSNIATYVQRAGVLEYATFRDPELTFGSLLSIFPFCLTSVGDTRESTEAEREGVWAGYHANIWLGLMVLCPRLFSAFIRVWLPTLSIDGLKAWKFDPKMDNDCTFLPAVWNILGVSAPEEPRSRSTWLCAAMIKRLPELAPIASHVVLLLSALCDSTADHEASHWLSEVGYHLLGSLHKVLSKHVLPNVLGADRDSSLEVFVETCPIGKSSGVVNFLENLQQHAHVVWKKALESYSESRCSCCDASTPDRPDSCDKNDTSGGCTSVEECEQSRTLTTQETGDGLGTQRGCMNRDPLIQLCQLLFLCCTEHVVADLLASAMWINPCPGGAFKPESAKRLMLVKKALKIVVGQGRGSLILERWIQRMIDHLHLASDEQALAKILALRHLLDLSFWQDHHLLMESASEKPLLNSSIATAEGEAGHEGQSRNVVWKLLRAEVDAKWLLILPLMHREGAWDLRLAVLGLLQQLPPLSSLRSQAVANRLKAVLGLYFSWLETFDGTGDMHLNEQIEFQHEHEKDKSNISTDLTFRWQYARAVEHLKRIIIKLASCSYPSFALMVNRVLDFSFERCPQIPTMPSPCSSKNTPLRTESSTAPLRRMSSAARTAFSVAPLSTGRLDRYGKLTLVSEWASEVERSIGALEISNMQLSEENSRIQSGGFCSLHNNERERFGKNIFSNQSNGGVSYPTVDSAENIRKGSQKIEIVGLELGSLLRRTLHRAISESGEASIPWPCHPLTVLGSLMNDRLETPHEVLMSMEQYEEVLPKHISSLRHIFLAECLSQNAFLMEMLELVVKHGESREVLRCVEFVRVLLADSISRWHSSFRTRRSHSSPPPKVDENEARSRMQAHRLIQLVASAGWLPNALASSAEIVSVIDGADIADLLLLVWRCMHHAVAFGSKVWGGSSSNLQGTRSSTDGQGLSTGSVGNEEAGKEGTYTEWERRYFSILRQNVAQIGPHFSQVYPLRKII